MNTVSYKKSSRAIWFGLRFPQKTSVTNARVLYWWLFFGQDRSSKGRGYSRFGQPKGIWRGVEFFQCRALDMPGPLRRLDLYLHWKWARFHPCPEVGLEHYDRRQWRFHSYYGTFSQFVKHLGQHRVLIGLRHAQDRRRSITHPSPPWHKLCPVWC